MGDTGAVQSFEAFVEEYGERAFQFAFRLSGNVEDSKELVQESFFRLLRTWRSLEPGKGVDSWFFQILRNLFVDGRRRYEARWGVPLDAPAGSAGPGEGLTVADTISDPDRSVIEILEREESVAAVRGVLDGMRYEYRAVLSMCDMEGMPYEDIAVVLGVPLGTVRSRINRAREEFKKRLLQRASREIVGLEAGVRR